MQLCGFADADRDLRCRFGATVVTARWLSTTALECDAPPLLDETAADDDTDASGVVALIALVALEMSFNGGAGASYGGVVDLLVTANGAFFEYVPTSDAARVGALAPIRGGARQRARARARRHTRARVPRVWCPLHFYGTVKVERTPQGGGGCGLRFSRGS